MEQKIHISGNLNLALALTIQVFAWGLLWFASQLDLVWSAPFGVLFSFLLLTNYALMHEASHHVLHLSSRMNYYFGVLSSSLFPMSFTLFEVTHRVHHRGNRTDPELFDYYYPHENKFIKNVQWYGILTGIYYPFVPLGSIIMAVAPWIYRTSLFTKRRTFRVIFNEFKGKILFLVRIETLFTISYWTGMWYVLGLRWETVLIFYALFGFNWSTRQFVTHAWTPRNILEGASNLKTTAPSGWVLLNGQWDHVHHKHPYLPWTELSNKKYHEITPIPYWEKYLSLWKGIRPVAEPEPVPIKDVYEHPEITYY